MQNVQSGYKDIDPKAVSRKKDHIELAFRSQVSAQQLDRRFWYEPMLAGHPKPEQPAESFPFLGKSMRVPLWVSSMTGGTEWAGTINRNLARACGEFGMGMGLGSCRSLLNSDEHLPDFDVRDEMGADAPLFANLGVAQVEQLLRSRELDRVYRLLEKLRADGLIIHVNPMQEAMQPEGDNFERSALETVTEFLEETGKEIPLIVKEVGQGMGPESLKALLRLPLAALDFGASGGTNFALLELLRNTPEAQETFSGLAQVGHTAEEMALLLNDCLTELGEARKCEQIIASGGVKSFLDGYYLVEKIQLPAVYGQASAFLKHARGEYADLQDFVRAQLKGLQLAQAFLRVR